MKQVKRIFISAISIWCVLNAIAVAQNQPEVGLEEEPVDAHRLYLRDTTVTLAPRDLRLDISLGYQSDEQEVLLSRFETRRLFGTTTISVGVHDRLEFNASLPLIWEDAERVDIDRTRIENTTLGFGDMVVGGRYVVIRERLARPEVVGSIDVIIPMGEDEFTVDSYGTVIGASAFKTFDPAFIFGAVSYTELFDKPDDGINYRFGVGFAVTHKITLGGEVLGGWSFDPDPFTTEDSASVRNRVTFSVSRNLFLEPSVKFGLNDDTPDFVYNFLVGYRL